MGASVAWVPVDPSLLAALQMAVLFVLLASLAGPWYWVLREQEDDGGYDATHGLGDTPKDDPSRSPDWCHTHEQIEKKEK